MKKQLALVMLSILSFPVLAASSAPTPTLKSEQDKLSYALGFGMGSHLKEQGIDINPSTLEEGLSDGFTGHKQQMTDEEMQATLLAFQKQMALKNAQKLNGAADQNAKDGQAFLNKNKTEKGVVVLPSGLQYKVITEGKGAMPNLNSTVTVDYAGQFINGQEFDSSYKRGEPTTFPLSDVIPGWQQALTLMKEGSTWEIYVPSNLAYGDRAMGPIGPNETLVFKIHLIKVNPAAKAS